MAAIVFFLLFQGLLVTRAHRNECKRETRCGDEGPAIRCPFWKMDQQPAHDCGYGPGFGLSCSVTNQTFLELSLSVKVLVQKIDYKKKEISIDNPSKCFPSLNLSSSPLKFSERLVKTYSLFSCPNKTSLTRFGQQVTCPRSPGHLVYAISSADLIKDRPLLSCVKMYNIPSVPTGIFDQGYSVLSWSVDFESDCSGAPEGTLCYSFLFKFEFNKTFLLHMSLLWSLKSPIIFAVVQ
ncbi:hypothetical protein RHGRI_017349 [Rhododendron griersonianum]|uniref:RING-type E3 ubiquitin transferase n=1 Tax=Rhododendron griersonianum TaxID=479676 RepID=A0AAV6JXH3_9ERIC|nr:hypothetical protein RHGRI_017349 [Rhododendron griersonianum]